MISGPQQIDASEWGQQSNHQSSHQSSHQSNHQQSPKWDNIAIEQFQLPPGEVTCPASGDHMIYLSLAPRPVQLLQIQAGKTYIGLYGKGDITITPAHVPLFARWDAEDSYLQIRISAQFVQQVAIEALKQDGDRLQLSSQFRTRDPQIESIALLLTEGNLGDSLYIESLSNILAIHLLRRYATTRPIVPIYTGGLPHSQLNHVLDYINDFLDQELKLADLAALVGMSQFHFSRLFKQSIGTSPYQYLMQQRVERAKQLLKQTDQSISEIAFSCGFNSHSHLSKQFRQLTGITPTVYRSQ